MTNHVYQTIELTGSSAVSSDDAVKTAIAKAAATGAKVRWFQVVETRGQVQDGQVAH